MQAKNSRINFGKSVLGPIFAEFSLRLWILLSGLNEREETTLLFCARGGLRLRFLYEHFLKASGLTSPVRICDLMVSRVVAVRVALLMGCPSAYEQIGYEMGSETLREIARAICGVALPRRTERDEWDEVYTKEGLERLLASGAGVDLRRHLQEQADMFREHLTTCLAGTTRAILCDTGLSGSTMRLLEDGMPDINWGCALFARSNYKKLSAEHYPRTVGLSVQCDRYSPLDRRSAILRYWHLTEATLEPDLQSVSKFERFDGVVRANLQVPGWQAKIAPSPGEIFAGIIDYVDGLPQGVAAIQILGDVNAAYAKLRRAVVWPTRADVDMLNIENRSLDFGRIDSMTGPACEPGLQNALKRSLWREGAVALASTSMRRPVLAAIEGAYVLRWALQSIRNRAGVL